jgi:hypothetical protein
VWSKSPPALFYAWNISGTPEYKTPVSASATTPYLPVATIEIGKTYYVRTLALTFSTYKITRIYTKGNDREKLYVYAFEDKNSIPEEFEIQFNEEKGWEIKVSDWEYQGQPREGDDKIWHKLAEPGIKRSSASAPPVPPPAPPPVPAPAPASSSHTNNVVSFRNPLASSGVITVVNPLKTLKKGGRRLKKTKRRKRTRRHH